MQKSFTLGVIAGTAALIIAVPLLAQFSSAQSSSTSSVAAKQRPIPTQACVQALAGSDAATLSSIDAFVSAEKTALQARQTALTAAAAIADNTQRQTAVQKAESDYRTAMQTAMQVQQTTNKSAMDAVKSACGAAGKFGGPGFEGMGGFGAGMRGPNPGDLAQKLGITQDQLNTELKSGKTLQQIAQEHGVQLPPMGGKHGGGFGRGPGKGSASSQATSA